MSLPDRKRKEQGHFGFYIEFCSSTATVTAPTTCTFNVGFRCLLTRVL